ncbi:MAG: hypothetical protein GY861_20865 [bacterium]|nr:hypothetical protein [bacterium]
MEKDRKKSTSVVEVVPVKLERHPNADRLSLIKVFGYTCVVSTEEYSKTQKAAYLPPDTMVPYEEPFKFLFTNSSRYDLNPDGTFSRNKKGGYYYRVTAKRFRGIMSIGVPIPLHGNEEIGDDLSEDYGTMRYEPYIASAGGEDKKPPIGVYAPNYDVDALLRYVTVFSPTELVVVTEKLHGENWRCVFDGEDFHVGSHTKWKREGKNLWWKALHLTPEIKKFCQNNVNSVVYGESIGGVRKFPYGVPSGQRRVRVFDILVGDHYIDSQELFLSGKYEGLPLVPFVELVKYDLDHLRSIVDGKSVLDDHIREGFVIKPVKERTDLSIGRVVLKLVSPAYLSRG